MGNQFFKTLQTMKFLAPIILLATLAQATPRHRVRQSEDVGSVLWAYFPQYRVARSAFPQAPPAFAIPDAIRSAEEQIAAGSGPSPAMGGGDAVDYGAYTGGYGAFGWYSDHPNHDGIGHRRRRAAIYFLDHLRVKRSPQEEPLRYAPAPPVPKYEEDQSLAGSTTYAKPHKGRVGPVYTFVKTDPKANFKWGVRHVAGVQYGK